MNSQNGLFSDFRLGSHTYMVFIEKKYMSIKYSNR